MLSVGCAASRAAGKGVAVSETQSRSRQASTVAVKQVQHQGQKVGCSTGCVGTRRLATHE